jgi:hypothetical protein
MNRHGKEALKYFEQMCAEDVQPDDTTFIRLLSACRHGGLVDEGMHCYTSMVTDYILVQSWIITPAGSTFFAMLAIYRR